MAHIEFDRSPRETAAIQIEVNPVRTSHILLCRCHEDQWHWVESRNQGAAMYRCTNCGVTYEMSLDANPENDRAGLLELVRIDPES